MEETKVGPGKSDDRYTKLQNFLEDIKDEDIDEYNNTVLEYAKTPAMDLKKFMKKHVYDHRESKGKLS